MASVSDSSFRRIPVIGVVGGIGSGKTAVTRWVARHADVAIIDADDLGHQVLRSDSVKSALRSRFGNEIFDESGEIQRGQLARRVFGEGDSQRAARADLERIVHPAIEQRVIAAIQIAGEQQRQAVLVDAAVLLEAGWQRRCDAVVFVDAPEDVRWRRVEARNGWSREEFQRREASQISLEEKKRRCDFIVQNAADDGQGGQELLDFLCRRWTVCCKRPSNSSQQSGISSEFLPP